ncbi:MAG: proprotein convertase P-domain-containing protein [Bacteroidota bacterium]
MDQACDNNTDYVDFNVNLDDETAMALPCNYIGGVTALLKYSLSAFDTQVRSGTWTLSITDHDPTDVGSLTGWGLQVCSTTITPVTFPFTGDSNWNVASNWANNAIPPANLPANGAIDINPAGTGQCIMNIPVQHILTRAKFTVKAGKMIVIPGSIIIQ